MVEEHLAMVRREDDDGVMVGLVVLQCGDQAANLVIQMRDAGIITGHGLAAQLRVAATVHAVQHHAVALRRGLVVPIAASGFVQVHIAVQVKIGRRRIKGRMRANKTGHEEEWARAVARLQKADGLVHNPIGGMQALLIDPGMRDPGVVLDAGTLDVGELA